MKLERTKRNVFKAPVDVGDVVQLHPNLGKVGGCMMIVTDLKVAGCLGYIMVPGEGAKHAKKLIRYDALQRIGHAHWVENMGIPSQQKGDNGNGER